MCARIAVSEKHQTVHPGNLNAGNVSAAAIAQICRVLNGRIRATSREHRYSLATRSFTRRFGRSCGNAA